MLRTLSQKRVEVSMPIASLARAPCATRRFKELEECISQAQARHTASTPAVGSTRQRQQRTQHRHLWSSTLLPHRTRARGHLRSTSASGQAQIASSERLSSANCQGPRSCKQAVRGAPAPVISLRGVKDLSR